MVTQRDPGAPHRRISWIERVFGLFRAKERTAARHCVSPLPADDECTIREAAQADASEGTGRGAWFGLTGRQAGALIASALDSRHRAKDRSLRADARWAQARWDRTASDLMCLARRSPWRAAGIAFVVGVVAKGVHRRIARSAEAPRPLMSDDR